MRSSVASLMLIAATAAAQPQQLTVDQWRADIDFAGAQLSRLHPNPFHDVARSTFFDALESLKARVPSISDFETLLGLQQVVALIREGHTRIVTETPGDTFYPIRIERLADGWFVTRTTEESRDACGAEVEAIDGMAMEEVVNRFATTVSRENGQWLLANVGTSLMRANVLYALGVTFASDSAIFTFHREGAHFSLRLDAVPQSSSVLAAPSSWPLYLQRSDQRYWSSWDPASRLMYVKYNVCQDDPRQSFAAFARDVFAIVDANDVQRFVIDVRNNGGGNSSVIQPLLDGISSRPKLRGRVYAIVGRETFSSGLFAAVDLQKRGAVLAGEGTGGKPNSWGEVASFVLPNSKVVVRYSTRFFTLVPGDPASLEPTLPVATSSTDFFAKDDPVLDAIVGTKASAALAETSRRRAITHPTLPRSLECPR